MALIIAGERSGVGKTTITLALLSFLSCKGYKIQSFKVGPDYIDPMFHTKVTGRPCRNLDPILTSETYVKSCFNRHSQNVDYALVEGVMGLFDGVPLSDSQQLQKKENLEQESINDFASTAHIARLLKLPVLLVIDCRKLSGSVAAIAQGYSSFDPRVKIAGFILNRVGSDRHLQLLQNALKPLHLPILGVLRRQDNISIPDRHLGLVPTAEINQLDALFDRLSHLAKNCFNWEQLLPLLKIKKTNSPYFMPKLTSTTLQRKKIAIARDRAFSFYYQDNLDILEKLGAELIPWSPINDDNLPEEVQGLYFAGGFPEVFAQQLSENKKAINSVKKAIDMEIPTYAECGGLMYLCEKLIDFENKSWQMVGVLPTIAVMDKRLSLGYRQATTLENSPCLKKEEVVWGHEFHHSHLTNNPRIPLFQTCDYNGKKRKEGWTMYQLHASYIHLHWGDYPEIPARFLGVA
ncbi:MAG: cobyrinate a,c-diamide synthase [Moorea sp. SIO2B7]|nr:cobyrinate a,c-diamide synthase [Moorena sp. SIO2B7]